MIRYLITLVLVFFFGYTQAQTISGTVKDANTKENLSYVNVGVVGRSIGTVTNDNGQFTLGLTNNNADSVRVSMLGYKPQSFSVGDLRKHTGSFDIALVPANIQLREVRVSNHKYIQKILGNTTKSKSVNAGFTSNGLGNEIGAIIKIKKSPTWLKQFNVSINENVGTDSVKLRLNIYSIKDGLPDKNLLTQNIFVTVHPKDDHITVNLESYNIMVNDNFFISLEWIKNSAGHGLKFSASFFGGAIISRETSQDKWEKIGIAGVGFNVLAEY